MKRAPAFILLLCVIFFQETFCGGDDADGRKTTPQCVAWGRVRDFVRSVDELNLKALEVRALKCSLDPDCNGLACLGKFRESEFKSEIKVNPCDDPIHVQVYLHIPSLNLSNTNFSLKNGDHIKLPVISLPVEISIKQQGPSLLVGLSRTQSGSLLQLLPLDNETFTLPACKTSKPTLFWTTTTTATTTTTVPASTNATSRPAIASAKSVVAPSCKRDDDCNQNETCSLDQCRCSPGSKRNSLGVCLVDADRNTTRSCNMTTLNACGKNEVCVQTSESSRLGFCFCQDDFILNEERCCVADDHPSEKAKSSVTLSLSITIPILILIALAGAALLAYKFRLVSRCRDRRGIRTYEVVDIGNDDDEPLVT